MIKDIKRMSVKEFRKLGYLQEVNRQFLHPLGLALEVIVDDETGAESFGEVWDYRSDPEGILYKDDLVKTDKFAAKAKSIKKEQKAKEKKRKSLVGAVVQPLADSFESMEKRIEKAIKASGQRKINVIYSAYDSGEDDNPIDNLDKVAKKGKIVLIREQHDGWGWTRKSYRSEVLENPTWLQIAVCANKMITICGDEHHVFLEGLDYKCKEGDIKVYRFGLGS